MHHGDGHEQEQNAASHAKGWNADAEKFEYFIAEDTGRYQHGGHSDC